MKLTVYKNQYGYATLCKGKDKEGNDQKCYMSVQFKRGLEPSGEKTYLEVEDAFFSCYADRNGNIIPKLVIMAWYADDRDDYVERQEEKPEEPVEAQKPYVSFDDLPF